MFLPPSTRLTSLTAWEIIYCAAAIKFGDYCFRKSPRENSNGNLEAWGTRGQNTHFHGRQEELGVPPRPRARRGAADPAPAPAPEHPPARAAESAPGRTPAPSKDATGRRDTAAGVIYQHMLET